eukprot:CAMPEP_0170459102 /NCGR_PEP_ID=MMETSP0123-20130129/5899_1 /TAXON_ID=182087 /ORGANISM="Favella ehrenbergii, Strain Fehren 1" /LENGTH=103 /DNA_ID=CAMNT_0010723569 /DNA_START=301 /DNA_END=611 /DNA_ORIENTATION=-
MKAKPAKLARLTIGHGLGKFETVGGDDGSSDSHRANDSGDGADVLRWYSELKDEKRSVEPASNARDQHQDAQIWQPNALRTENQDHVASESNEVNDTEGGGVE